MKPIYVIAITFTLSLPVVTSVAQQAPASSNQPPRAISTNSYVAQALAGRDQQDVRENHALRQVSQFAIAPLEPRQFKPHDLIQIIVRETSRAKSSQELEAEKEYDLDGEIPAWPDFGLQDLLELQIKAGRTTNTPELRVGFDKEFKGEGEYERQDDFTARLTAEVIDILPNGNLILEAKTSIRTDQEQATLKVTGMCRQDDVTVANTILSNQLHDLEIQKVHSGELKEAGEKGVIAKVLDTIFAF